MNAKPLTQQNAYFPIGIVTYPVDLAGGMAGGGGKEETGSIAAGISE